MQPRPQPLLLGEEGGGEVEPANNFSKRAGLTEPQFLEGFCWERGWRMKNFNIFWVYGKIRVLWGRGGGWWKNRGGDGKFADLGGGGGCFWGVLDTTIYKKLIIIIRIRWFLGGSWYEIQNHVNSVLLICSCLWKKKVNKLFLDFLLRTYWIKPTSVLYLTFMLIVVHV